MTTFFDITTYTTMTKERDLQYPTMTSWGRALAGNRPTIRQVVRKPRRQEHLALLTSTRAQIQITLNLPDSATSKDTPIMTTFQMMIDRHRDTIPPEGLSLPIPQVEPGSQKIGIV